MIVSLPPVSQCGPENTIVNSLLATTFVLCDHWHDFISPTTLLYCPTLAPLLSQDPPSSVLVCPPSDAPLDQSPAAVRLFHKCNVLVSGIEVARSCAGLCGIV